jgi:signal transduction histidine kinase
MAIGWLHRHPRIVDWALFLIAAVTTIGAAARHGRPAIGVPVALIACLPLLFRRSHPLPTLAVTVAATAGLVAGWGSYNPLAVGIALYTVADQCERRRSLTAAVITLVVLAVPLQAHEGLRWGATVLGQLVGFGAAWLIGDSVRSRRRYLGALEERAERLERERETEAARAVAEEQARIAREVHDVIAHTISVIVVQAAAARDVLAARPERAGEALENIEGAARGALGELRRLLGTVGGDAPLVPQPGLDGLDELVGQVRAAGLDVAVTVEGRQRDLPPALDLSAYRVVQEALTNTLKHAHATRADVELRYLGDALDVEIRDDGTANGAAADSQGRGLLGMRERVTSFGGTLSVGPGSGGGFVVSAHFPLVEAA